VTPSSSRSLHTCVLTATTVDMRPQPGCKACLETLRGERCTHEGKPCPTANGTPQGDAGGCPCDHCYPRARQVPSWWMSPEDDAPPLAWSGNIDIGVNRMWR
jgi:hypothetical protein